MFSFPVVAVIRTDHNIQHLTVNVAIDEICSVTNLLDKSHDFDVESFPLHQLCPQSEILFNDGRKLPVANPYNDILQYLDGYRVLEGFYTKPPTAPVETDGVVVSLFRNKTCAIMEGSTPD